MDRNNLKSLIGRDFISRCGTQHARIAEICDGKNFHKDDPFKEYIIRGCMIYSYVPLNNNNNAAMTPEDFFKNYIEKTKATEILLQPRSGK